MALFWMIALASAPAAASNTAPAPSVMSVQQQFDSASEAAVKRDCAKAVPLFEALERDPRLKRGSFAAAATAVRKGACLIQQGRTEEGEAAITRGLPQIERAGPNFVGDYTDSENSLGDAALSRWDYDSAKRHFQAGLAKQQGLSRLSSLGRLARATAFDGGGASLGYIDEALRLLTADPQPTPKDVLSQWRTLRGRTLLNQGRNAEAYAELNMALGLSGGLTLQTTVNEASMRGDLALAALLLGKKEDARRFMAYTGQGRMTKTPFASAASMAPPECGDATGLRPQDFAVVEFAIGDDGTVFQPQTMYSRGGPDVAAAFAKAVADWSWAPEDAKQIPPFYRVGARVELRCSAAAGPSQDIGKLLFERQSGWASKQTGIAMPDGPQKQAALDALSRIVAETKTAGPFDRYAAAVVQQVFLAPQGSSDSIPRIDALLAAPELSTLPPEVVAALHYSRRQIISVNRLSAQKHINNSDKTMAAEELLAFSQDPAVAGDPLVTATAKLVGVALLPRKDAALRANPFFQQVADDDRLGPTSRLRQLALLNLANASAAKGDLTAAQSYFQRTGLTEQQCALLGPTPAMRRSGVGPGDFPDEAMAYGFEGWVRLEFDISADGKAGASRAIIAYPPFVFVDAATKMSGGMRFDTSYRPGGSVACNANTSTIRFIMR